MKSVYVVAVYTFCMLMLLSCWSGTSYYEIKPKNEVYNLSCLFLTHNAVQSGKITDFYVPYIAGTHERDVWSAKAAGKLLFNNEKET